MTLTQQEAEVRHKFFGLTMPTSGCDQVWLGNIKALKTMIANNRDTDMMRVLAFDLIVGLTGSAASSWLIDDDLVQLSGLVGRIEDQIAGQVAGVVVTELDCKYVN